MSTPDPDFLLRLRALHGYSWRTPPVQRLKLALKRLLRDYGLRCIECAPQQAAKAEKRDEAKAP